MCTNLLLEILCLSNLHRNAVSTARISSALMCSALPVHRQLATAFQRQSFAGILARNLWYRVRSSDAAWIKISSPLMLTKVRSFFTSSNCPVHPPPRREVFIDGLLRNVWRSFVQPGVVRCTTSCGDRLGLSPSRAPSWLNNQLTTVTFHEFPIRLMRTSLWWKLPWSFFGRQCSVKSLGNPMITSRSCTLGSLRPPLADLSKYFAWYW